MKAKITEVIESNSVETTVRVELASGETFTTSFDKRFMAARYSGFKHRYGCSPDNSEGIEVSAQPPCDIHGGKIDILAN